MTVKIDGTNTEANPAFTGADTDTGLQCGTNELKLVTGGTARATIDDSGRLMLGTTTEGEHTADDLTVATSGDTGISIRSGTSSSGKLFFSDGTSSADEYRGFIQYSHSNNAMSFGTDSTERMSIDSSGNLGLGTSSPSAAVGNAQAFQIYSASASPEIRLTRGNGTDASITAGSTSGGGLGFQSSGFIKFSTNGNNERLRLDSNGRLLSGVTSAEDSNSTLEIIRNSGQNHVRCQSNSLANGQYAMFRAFGNTSGGGTRQAYIGVYKHSGIVNPGAFMLLEQEDGGNSYYWTDNSGKLRTSTANSNIGTTGGTIVGSQSSDLRLKNVGANVSYGLAEVKQLQPKQYALKDDPDVNCLGFIAQEVESIIPEAVFDTLEELDGHQEGDRTKLGMEYVQLIPVLVNAIKELSAEVDTLKTKVATLEAAE